jgi:hypothetical protein
MYCYLLAIIEKSWETEDKLIRRLLLAINHSVMINILTPLARVFVQQPWGSDGEHAGPAFQRYKLDNSESSDVDKAGLALLQAGKDHLANTISQAPSEETRAALVAIEFSFERVDWPI